jgi:hypothetical protein
MLTQPVYRITICTIIVSPSVLSRKGITCDITAQVICWSYELKCVLVCYARVITPAHVLFDHFCRDLDLPRGSSLTQEDFASGLARLMALDHVLVIGQVSNRLLQSLRGYEEVQTPQQGHGPGGSRLTRLTRSRCSRRSDALASTLDTSNNLGAQFYSCQGTLASGSWLHTLRCCSSRAVLQPFCT